MYSQSDTDTEGHDMYLTALERQLNHPRYRDDIAHLSTRSSLLVVAHRRNYSIARCSRQTNHCQTSNQNSNQSPIEFMLTFQS